MKIPDTITAKVLEFRERFVIEETAEEGYIKDNNATPLITFLEQALLDVRRETIKEGVESISYLIRESNPHAEDQWFDGLRASKSAIENLPNTPTV